MFINITIRIESELQTRRQKRLAKSDLNNLIIKGGNQKDKKIVKLPDFQFFENRERLIELITKELDFMSKNKDSKPEGDKEDIMRSKEDEESKKDQADGLTNEERAEKEKLMLTGFIDWNKDEFAAFLRGCERYGRKDFKAISEVSIKYIL